MPKLTIQEATVELSELRTAVHEDARTLSGGQYLDALDRINTLELYIESEQERTGTPAPFPWYGWVFLAAVLLAIGSIAGRYLGH